MTNTENTRQKISKYQIMIMSIYYNKRVPRDLVSAKKDLDHIIPFSYAKGINEVNINRLGNLMLIESSINKKKGNKQLTDRFIAEHHLGYYNYPNEKEYATICSGNTIRDYNLYNKMCERREKAFLKIIEELI